MTYPGDILADTIGAGVAEGLRNNGDRHSKWRTGTVVSVVDPTSTMRQVEVRIDGDPEDLTTTMRSVNAVEVGQRALVVYSAGGGVWCMGALGGQPDEPVAPPVAGGFPGVAVGDARLTPASMWNGNTDAPIVGASFPFVSNLYPVWQIAASSGDPGVTLGGSGGGVDLGLHYDSLYTIVWRWVLRQNSGTFTAARVWFNHPSALTSIGYWVYPVFQGAPGNGPDFIGWGDSYSWTGRWANSFVASRVVIDTNGTAGGSWRFTGWSGVTTAIDIVRWD